MNQQPQSESYKCPLMSDPDSILRRMEGKLDNLDTLLRGPDEDPASGMAYRLAAVEEKLRLATKVIVAMVCGIATLIGHTIWSVISTGKIPHP